jgi:hypothetical protein
MDRSVYDDDDRPDPAPTSGVTDSARSDALH